MRTLGSNNQCTADFKRMDISHLAEFLNITIANLDELTAKQQADLLQQLVTISQMKLTRLALRHY